MFFNRPKVLIYLKSRSLEIYYLKSKDVLNVSFDHRIIRHLQITDQDKFIQLLVQTIKQTGLTNEKAVIVLSDQVVFDKLITSEKKAPDELQHATYDFFENIPLERNEIAKKITPMDKSLLLLGTNREIYKNIIEIAKEFDWEIKAVIPMVLFAKLDENITLTPDQIKEVLNAKDIISQANFLAEDLFETKPETNQNPASKTTILLAVIFILIVTAVLSYALIFLKIIKLPDKLLVSGSILAPAVSLPPEKKAADLTQQEKTRDVSKSAEKSAESTNSSLLKKEEVKIHILNGSAIPGQAIIIKDKLTEKGFAAIITGNIDRSEATQSSITYSQKVPAPLKDEINNLMDSLVKGIIRLDDNFNEFDVLIILGTLENPIK